MWWKRRWPDAARGIKAYTIGVDALGRDAGFDPQSDAIVRVEAARLRRALETYFAGEGRNDPILIELPTGRYMPMFQCNVARRRVGRRFAELKERFWLALQANYRLILLIAVVAAMVSFAIDVTWMLLGEKAWPALQHAGENPPPASTGACRAEALAFLALVPVPGRANRYAVAFRLRLQSQSPPG